MVRKRFIAVALVLLLGALLWGWIAFNAGSEWPAAWLSPPQSKPVVAKVGVQAADWQGLVRDQNKTWGDILIKGCDAGMADFQVARFDTDGDAVADKVCWRPIQTGQYGNFIGVAVVGRDKDGGTRRSGYAVLPAGPSAAQPGVKGFAGTDHVAVSVKAVGRIALSRQGDTVWLSWPQDAAGQGVPLVAESKAP